MFPAGPTSLPLHIFFFPTLALSLQLCPLLRLSCCHKPIGRSGRYFLLSSSVLSGYNESPDTRFFLGTTWLMSWSVVERYSSSLQSLVLSLLLSLVSILSFLGWRCTVSSKFFGRQVPSVSIVGLVLPRLARCVFSRLRCNGNSLLISFYLTSAGRIETSTCSACGGSSQDTSHLILHCPATDSLRRSLCGNSLSLSTTSGPNGGGVDRLLRLHDLAPCPIHWKGSVTTTKTT